MITSLEAVTYTYPGMSAPALREVSLAIEPGAYVLLAGPSASGKSTLLRVFNGLVPQFYGGTFGGRASVGGFDPASTPARRMARVAGMVFQEPEAQGVGATVEDDIAFGMEQQGVERGEMARRIDRLLESVGIARLRDRSLATLSGGERQRAAIAAAMALQPSILLADEPTSQLDPAGAESVAVALDALSAQGTAIVLSEHRLERFLPRAQAVAVMGEGRAALMAPRCALRSLADVPPFVEAARRSGVTDLPLTPGEALTALASADLEPAARDEPRAPGDLLLSVRGARVRFGEKAALDGVDLDVREGEIVALMGENGSGKTTLLRVIAGLQASEGAVAFRGAAAPEAVRERSAFAGLVPQDPAVALFAETVRDEVREGVRHRPGAHPDAAALLDRWQLGNLAQRNPRDLSVGQQLRVAVTAMLAHEPTLWLMDEPTRGADGAGRARMATILKEHAARGGSALVATHDVEAAAQFATRVVGITDGKLTFDLAAHEALGPGGPHPVSLSRVIPWARTLEDIAW